MGVNQNQTCFNFCSLNVNVQNVNRSIFCLSRGKNMMGSIEIVSIANDCHNSISFLHMKIFFIAPWAQLSFVWGFFEATKLQIAWKSKFVVVVKSDEVGKEKCILREWVSHFCKSNESSQQFGYHFVSTFMHFSFQIFTINR